MITQSLINGASESKVQVWIVKFIYYCIVITIYVQIYWYAAVTVQREMSIHNPPALLIICTDTSSVSSHCWRHCTILSSLRVHPPAARSWLPLAVEVHGSHWWTEVVELRKIPGVEVLAPTWSIHSLPPQLLKQHKDKTMDAKWWPRALITHDLLPWGQRCMIHSVEILISALKVTKNITTVAGLYHRLHQWFLGYQSPT